MLELSHNIILDKVFQISEKSQRHFALVSIVNFWFGRGRGLKLWGDNQKVVKWYRISNNDPERTDSIGEHYYHYHQEWVLERGRNCLLPFYCSQHFPFDSFHFIWGLTAPAPFFALFLALSLFLSLSPSLSLSPLSLIKNCLYSARR